MREILRPGLVLTLVALISSISLSVVHSVTKDAIERQLIANKNEAMHKVLPSATEFKELTVEQGFDVEWVVCGESEKGITGYVISVTTNGYGGELEVLTAVDPEGMVAGVDVVNHNETPGLGANAANTVFLSQYTGKTGTFYVVKSAGGYNDVQAIAGATITTRAVTDCVNIAVEYFYSVLNGSQINVGYDIEGDDDEFLTIEKAVD